MEQTKEEISQNNCGYNCSCQEQQFEYPKLHEPEKTIVQVQNVIFGGRSVSLPLRVIPDTVNYTITPGDGR